MTPCVVSCYEMDKASQPSLNIGVKQCHSKVLQELHKIGFQMTVLRFIYVSVFMGIMVLVYNFLPYIITVILFGALSLSFVFGAWRGHNRAILCKRVDTKNAQCGVPEDRTMITHKVEVP